MKLSMMILCVLALGFISTAQAIPLMRIEHHSVIVRPAVTGVFSPMEKQNVIMRHPESGTMCRLCFFR